MALVTLAYMEGWKYVPTVEDVMAIKPKFLASMGYHIFLIMVLRARALGAKSTNAGIDCCHSSSH